jgi:hypothetical protein
MMQLFLSSHQNLLLKRRQNISRHKIIQQISFPNNEENKPSKSVPFSSPKYIYLPSLTKSTNDAIIFDKIYPMKIQFAESMYRVIIHDSGLDFMYNPERFIRWAVPSINRNHAKQIIDYARINKEAIVITAPLNQALFYMKKLQRFSFTTRLVEA